MIKITYIDNNVKSIECERIQPFEYMNRSDIQKILLEDVDSVGIGAFLGCVNLHTLEMNKVNTIEIGAFKDCKSLDTLICHDDSFKFSKVILDDREDARIIGICSPRFERKVFDRTCLRKVLTNKEEGTTVVKIPEGYTEIDVSCFEDFDSELFVELPSSMRVIREKAFQKSNLVMIKLNKELERIEQYAFCDCKLLNTIELPDNLQEIDFNAFEGCSSIGQINLSKDLNSLGDEVLGDKSGDMYDLDCFE